MRRRWCPLVRLWVGSGAHSGVMTVVLPPPMIIWWHDERPSAMAAAKSRMRRTCPRVGGGVRLVGSASGGFGWDGGFGWGGGVDWGGG
eukprot:4388705-Prymnesium_polylepis.1